MYKKDVLPFQNSSGWEDRHFGDHKAESLNKTMVFSFYSDVLEPIL